MTVGPELRGERVVLVGVTAEHVPELRRILHTPEVRLRWGNEAASPQWPFDDPSATRFAVVLDGAVSGMVQYGEEDIGETAAPIARESMKAVPPSASALRQILSLRAGQPRPELVHNQQVAAD